MGQAALNIFLRHYTPCQDRKDVTDTFSTEEIAQTLQRHTGAYVSHEAVYDEMVLRKYSYDVVNGNELHWLMKKAGTVTLVLSDGRT